MSIKNIVIPWHIDVKWMHQKNAAAAAIKYRRLSNGGRNCFCHKDPCIYTDVSTLSEAIKWRLVAIICAWHWNLILSIHWDNCGMETSCCWITSHAPNHTSSHLSAQNVTTARFRLGFTQESACVVLRRGGGSSDDDGRSMKTCGPSSWPPS